MSGSAKIEYRARPVVKALYVLLPLMWVNLAILHFIDGKVIFAVLYCLLGILWFIVVCIPILRRLAFVIDDNGLVIHCMWLKRRTLPWRDVKGVQNIRRRSAVLLGNFRKLRINLSILSKSERADFIDQIRKYTEKFS